MIVAFVVRFATTARPASNSASVAAGFAAPNARLSPESYVHLWYKLSVTGIPAVASVAPRYWTVRIVTMLSLARSLSTKSNVVPATPFVVSTAVHVPPAPP